MSLTQISTTLVKGSNLLFIEMKIQLTLTDPTITDPTKNVITKLISTTSATQMGSEMGGSFCPLDLR